MTVLLSDVALTIGPTDPVRLSGARGRERAELRIDLTFNPLLSGRCLLVSEISIDDGRTWRTDGVFDFPCQPARDFSVENADRAIQRLPARVSTPTWGITGSFANTDGYQLRLNVLDVSGEWTATATVTH